MRFYDSNYFSRSSENKNNFFGQTSSSETVMIPVSTSKQMNEENKYEIHVFVDDDDDNDD